MNSTNSSKMRLLVHIESTGSYSQRFAFAITNASDDEITPHLSGANLKPSDMTVISTGLDKDVYELFSTYVGKKFHTEHNTVRDVQDLWVVWAKDHGVSSPQDTNYAKNDNSGSSFTTSARTFSSGLNPDNDANIRSDSGSSSSKSTPNIPETAKDNSHPIHDDVFVPYDANVSGIYINNAIGITNERLEVLAAAIKKAITDEVKDHADPRGVNVAKIISDASKAASTHAELLYIGYLAGTNIENLRAHEGGLGSSMPDSLM